MTVKLVAGITGEWKVHALPPSTRTNTSVRVIEIFKRKI